MRYVRMWYIIRHTKTKIIARVHTAHGTRHACRLFFWDVSIRNSLRSNNKKNVYVPGTYIFPFFVVLQVCNLFVFLQNAYRLNSSAVNNHNRNIAT